MHVFRLYRFITHVEKDRVANSRPERSETEYVRLTYSDLSVHCPNVCLYNLWPSPDNGPNSMIVPESGVILAEDANDIDQWDPDCMMDMIVELIAAVVTLALDPPPPPVVDAKDGMEEVTMELDNPPLAVINDMDTTIEDTAVSQPVDDTIIESHDMEEHQSNKRRRVDNIDIQESKHCIVCGQLSWNGYQYVCMCDVREYCHYHERWEGPLYGIDICQTATMEIATNAMSSTPIDDNDADANIVEMDYASQIQVQALQIPADNNNPQFNRLLQQPLVLDSGSKPTVFRLMSTFTQYAPCSLTLTLRHTDQEMMCSQLEVHGVGHVGGLKRCLHVPESYHNLLSMSHYLSYYPKSLFICTTMCAYLLQTPYIVNTDYDLLHVVLMFCIVARFYTQFGLYVSHDNDFLYQRESDVPDIPHPFTDIVGAREYDNGPIINMLQSEVMG